MPAHRLNEPTAIRLRKNLANPLEELVVLPAGSIVSEVGEQYVEKYHPLREHLTRYQAFVFTQVGFGLVARSSLGPPLHP